MRHIGVLFLVLAFCASAQADSSVDWSRYVESGPSKPLVEVHPSKSELETRAKAKQQAPKRVASKAKARKSVKARAKKPSRRK